MAIEPLLVFGIDEPRHSGEPLATFESDSENATRHRTHVTACEDSAAGAVPLTLFRQTSTMLKHCHNQTQGAAQ
jgi:hypothetical protein